LADLRAIRDAVFVEGEIHGFPLNSASGANVYTPIEDLPASTKLLFDYNPVLAKDMLALAGYPDGFSVELVIRSDPEFQDMGALIAAMWGKIGVETSLITLDTALHDMVRTNHDYKDAFLWETGSSSIPGHARVGVYWNDAGHVATSIYNSSNHNDPAMDELYFKAEGEVDYAKMEAYTKQLCIDLIDSAAYIPMANPYQLCYAWPWVKNYYGEVETGFINYEPMWQTMWVDQALKAEMGY